MLFGSDGIFKIPFENYNLAQNICTAALIIIMFYGGFGTSWKSAKSQAVPAGIMSSAGTVLTALATGCFCHFVLAMPWLDGMLMGAVISSTDAASVFVVLRSHHLNLKDNAASLLELESGSNDPFAYMLTITFISMRSGASSVPSTALMLLSQVAIGIAVGVGAAFISYKILKRIDAQEGIGSILVLAVALLSYGIAESLGGNGYLSTYLTGIILGNQQLSGKKELVHFFDGLTGLTQMVIFFLLGLLSFPSSLKQAVLPAVLLILALTFIIRPAVTFLLLQPFHKSTAHKLLVSMSGLRGASSIVFAIMATVACNSGPTGILFHTVFLVVLFSIGIQGTMIPFAAKWLNMIDSSGDVMKTFSDYTEENSVQFIQLHITQNHPWEDKTVKQLQLAPELRLSMILRNEKQIVPRGNTVIKHGDTVVACAPALSVTEAGKMSEKRIDSDDPWCDLPISEIKMPHCMLVIMILRDNKSIVPNGATIIKSGDVLIINEEK